MIKAIILDVNGVILMNTGDVHSYIAKKLSIDKDRLRTFFIKHLKQLLNGELHHKEFCKIVEKEFGVGSMEATWLEAQIETKELNESLIEILKNIRKNGYKIGIISNTQTLSAKYRREKFKNEFDSMVFSSEAKTAKPDKKVFGISLLELGLKADDCAFFDDSKKNVDAAKSYGFHAFVFKNNKQFKKDLKSLGVKW